jgi:hypothetical protein
MKTNRYVVCFLAALLTLFLLSEYSFAQSDVNQDSMLELLRGDMRTSMEAIVTKAMALQPGEAEKFWPVYRSYEAEVTTLNNERLKLMKEYAEKYNTLTDAEAKALVERSLEWQTHRTDLQRKYFYQMANATSNLTAAKFFQLEHRFNLAVDLGIASELPSLFLESVEVSEE